MASVNGVLSPPSQLESSNPALPHSAKRKREESVDDAQKYINGVNDLTSAATNEHAKQSINDLIDVLRNHDTSPSILTRALAERTSSSEPQAKRQKSQTASEPSTILARASSQSYATLDDVLTDIDSAVDDIMEMLELTNDATRIQYSPIDPKTNEQAIKISAFKQRAHELVQKEKASRKQIPGYTNGNPITGSAGSKSLTHASAKSGDHKLVLTLYGNAPQPKQLFSSLQLPTKVAGEDRDILQILREAGLPNGITTTQIVPIQSTNIMEDKPRIHTLGELFPTPSTIPPMQPPKPSKVATTRSSTVGWYQPAAADPLPRTGSYFKQPISTGHWLDYSHAAPAPPTKRKARDRAMSLGGSKAPQSDVEPAESDAAKLDTLFRGAYSGFAPTRDDAAAIVPEGMINRIWWQRIGHKSFERMVENADSFGNVDAAEPEMAVAEIDKEDEDENFRKAVEWFEAEAIDPTLETTVKKSAEEKDVEEILEGISELLETLSSYQRIRHMSLNASSRPAGLLSTPDARLTGTTSKPSDSEFATYEILKSQLSLMIASLPPFAVAKLDPNQLAELSISTKIPIEVENYKGVMEEDEASAKAKAAALSAASTSRVAQPAPAPRPSSAALYGNQYAPRPAATPAYYGQQTPIRPPVSNLQRQTSTAPAPFPQQRPAPAPYRPTSFGTPTYQQHQARPIQQQYTATHNQGYHSTPPTQAYARPVGQPYQSVAQSAPQAPMARYSQAPYPQQAPNHAGVNYQYGNGANTGRQASPQKPVYSPQPTPAQIQGRPSYPTATVPMGQERRSYLQNPMMQSPVANGGSSQSPQPQQAQQQQLGPTNYSTFMTTAEQSNMMERQRAQLAQQQAGTQQQARQMAQAAMGSPSKTQVNGNAVAAGL